MPDKFEWHNKILTNRLVCKFLEHKSLANRPNPAQQKELTNKKYNEYFNSILGYIPASTLPTRVTDTSKTLIYNVYTKGCSDNHIGGILNSISDHQIIFHCQKLNLYFKPDNKYIEIERLTDTNIDIPHEELDQSNIYSELDLNSVVNYNKNIDIFPYYIAQDIQK